MDAGKLFDPYEIVGVVTPGTVVALLLVTEAPTFRGMMGKDGLSLGDFGLFLLVAFVFGHLIQAAGNLLERVVWPLGGLPSNWVRSPRQKLVSANQRRMLEEKISVMEGAPLTLAHINRVSWRAIVTRAYARVRTAGRSFRIDFCNKTYGLCRGLAAALAVSLVWYLYAHHDQKETIALLILFLVAAVWRMRRAGIHYARALILEFIDLDQPDSLTPKSVAIAR